MKTRNRDQTEEERLCIHMQVTYQREKKRETQEKGRRESYRKVKARDTMRVID